MPLTPFFRSPFTDLTGGLVNSQHYGKCGEFELEMLECIEAYGQDRGKKKCKDLIEDYNECVSLTKSTARLFEMRKERLRQHLSGELKQRWQEKQPKIDSF